MVRIGAPVPAGARQGRRWPDRAARRQQRLHGPRRPEPGRGATEVQDRVALFAWSISAFWTPSTPRQITGNDGGSRLNEPFWIDGNLGRGHAGRADARRGGGGQHGHAEPRDATGGPYHRQHVVFAANQGDPGFSTPEHGFRPHGLRFSRFGGSSMLNPAGPGPVAPGVHIAQVVEDPSPRSGATIPVIPMPGPMGRSRIRTLIPSQRCGLYGATRAYV